jgi:hypothetical protein
MNDLAVIDGVPRAVELDDHHVAAQHEDHQVLHDNDRGGHDGYDHDDEPQTAADTGPAQANVVGTSSAQESGAALVADEATDGVGAPAVSTGQENEEGGAHRDRAPEDSCALLVHPLALLFPPMTDGEFQAFKTNVLAHPELNKEVWVHEGKILDGRHADRARRELGLPVEYRNWNGEGGTPLDFVVARNLHRRHLNRGMKPMPRRPARPSRRPSARFVNLLDTEFFVDQSVRLRPSKWTKKCA